MKSAFLFISLAFLVTGAQAAGTGFTFYRDHIDGEVVKSWGSVKFEPSVFSKSTGCVDGEHGIKAVKVDYGWDITDRINCIRGYKKKDCEDEELAFTFPWDSDVKGDGNYTFPSTVFSAEVTRVSKDKCPDQTY